MLFYSILKIISCANQNNTNLPLLDKSLRENNFKNLFLNEILIESDNKFLNNATNFFNLYLEDNCGNALACEDMNTSIKKTFLEKSSSNYSVASLDSFITKNNYTEINSPKENLKNTEFYIETNNQIKIIEVLNQNLLESKNRSLKRKILDIKKQKLLKKKFLNIEIDCNKNKLNQKGVAENNTTLNLLVSNPKICNEHIIPFNRNRFSQKIAEILHRCINLSHKQIDILNRCYPDINNFKVILSEIYSLLIMLISLYKKLNNKIIKIPKKLDLCCMKKLQYQTNVFDNYFSADTFFKKYNKNFQQFLILSLQLNKQISTLQNKLTESQNSTYIDSKIIENNKQLYQHFYEVDLKQLTNMKLDKSILQKCFEPGTSKNLVSLFFLNIDKKASIEDFQFYQKYSVIENSLQKIINKINLSITNQKFCNDEIIKSENMQTQTVIKNNLPYFSNENSKIANFLFSKADYKKSSSSSQTEFNEETNSDEKYEDEDFRPKKNELYNVKIYLYDKCVFVHKNANLVSAFHKKYINIFKNLMKTENFEHEEKNFPKGFSFSPGWRKYKMLHYSTFTTKIKNPYLFSICTNYQLEKYFFLIFNMVRTNTYSEKNRYISYEYCFHLICFHLCTKWNLGIGKKCETSKNYVHHNILSNENFHKLFKTKKFWFIKARTLLENAKKRALKELQITKSTFAVEHLYNILLLLRLKNPKTVAFVCYVYHATVSSEVDHKLELEIKNMWYLIIEKRKIFFKISEVYSKIIKSVNSNYCNSKKLGILKM
ncbi:hypothetical protein NUSPORA_02416 [Nucleospora cyclopteri]